MDVPGECPTKNVTFKKGNWLNMENKIDKGIFRRNLHWQQWSN